MYDSNNLKALCCELPRKTDSNVVFVAWSTSGRNLVEEAQGQRTDSWNVGWLMRKLVTQLL